MVKVVGKKKLNVFSSVGNPHLILSKILHMICPLRKNCKTKCNQDIYAIIGIYSNHISCNQFKSNKNETNK
jgi:hypothetical protein